MNRSLSLIICTIGIALLAHSVLSALQHRSYLRLTNKSFEHIPYDIALESIVALLVSSWGIINLAPKLIPIKATHHLSKRSYESIDYRPDFIQFNNRARYLSDLLAEPCRTCR
ncbi:putative transmembrane protein [Heterostelium album PN500]|uniref:Putative transmembrane protein n=1 Tax=Heterostelium pallidum (strain ATCC 26659 / Pp 5 / PN500) TaxID=670386 RepID=D3BU55_HETP5|nr:putative transmembrane protein [Heterostelium album PN500]EFA75056.1 putative transmembrane protein [Heterostelium album PN500]|eukprot:XP_020427190.1 putative transmembrane protein [Heterostelium album PN500]